MNEANLGDEVFMGVSVNKGRHRPAKNLSKTQKNLTDEASSQHRVAIVVYHVILSIPFHPVNQLFISLAFGAC